MFELQQTFDNSTQLNFIVPRLQLNSWTAGLLQLINLGL